MNISEQKDIGLIIQGLINDDNFDCNKNINQILFKYSHLFKDIIITTWKTQAKYIQIDHKSKANIKINLLDDPGCPKTYTNEDKNYNDYRIYFQSYSSIKQLKNKYIVKIRSDMEIDLNASLTHYFNELSRKKKDFKINHNIICGSSFRIDIPFGLGDLFFMGENNTLKDFFYAQVKMKRFRFNLIFGSSESEVIKKFLFFKRKKLKYSNKNIFFPLIKKNILDEASFFDKDSLYLWQFAIRNFFTILDDNIRSQIKLRGKLVNEDLGRIDTSYSLWVKSEKDFFLTFKEEIKSRKSMSFIIQLPSFLKVSYQKIYEFKKRKKAPIYLLFLTKLYLILNYILFLLDRIKKK